MTTKVRLFLENKIDIDIAVTYEEVSVPIEEFTLFVWSDQLLEIRLRLSKASWMSVCSCVLHGEKE